MSARHGVGQVWKYDWAFTDMETTSLIALSKQGVLRRQMDVIANNIANMNTTGFKGEKMMFVQYLVRNKSGDGIVGDKISYVRDIATMRDTSEGPLKKTGNPLDIAVRGEAYLTVQTAQGDRYTRNGHLRLDETGQLVTQAGNPILSDAGQPFFFAPEDSGITITRDGIVSTNNGDLGRLKIVEFANRQDLRQIGGGLLATDKPPQTVTTPDVVQGMLEKSNVNAIAEMTKMIEVNRAYGAAKKFIDREDERIKLMIKTVSEAI